MELPDIKFPVAVVLERELGAETYLPGDTILALVHRSHHHRVSHVALGLLFQAQHTVLVEIGVEPGLLVTAQVVVPDQRHAAVSSPVVPFVGHARRIRGRKLLVQHVEDLAENAFVAYNKILENIS